MPINWLRYEDFFASIATEMAKPENLPGTDPTVKKSWQKGFAVGVIVGCLALQEKEKDIVREMFPQSASRETNENIWGALENLPPNPATGGNGLISQEGDLATVIGIGEEYRGSNGIIYEVDQVATVVSNVIDVLSITRSGSIATVTTDGTHNLGNGQEATIAGADQAEYNGTFVMTVPDRDKLRYEVTGTPVTPATGTITASYQTAIVSVKAKDETGQNTNIEGGGALSLIGSIGGIDEPAIVTFDGITGGAAIEGDEAYANRIILARSIIEGVFTRDQIKLAALSVSGNTRAFVESPESSVCSLSPTFPVAGQVTVYIVRDNDISIIPSQSILDETKEKIIADGKLPAQTSEIDVYVLAPELVEVDFTFTELTPDTPTMRSAVEAQLKAFFEDSTDFAKTIQSDSYRGTIQNTQDLTTGGFLESFELSAPTGDIVLTIPQIAVLGTVTFSI